MSKRRDALRRGVRALIRDASRELAVLEGRPLPPEPDGAGARATTPRAPLPAPAVPEPAEHRPVEKPSAPGSLWPDGLGVDEAPARPTRPVTPQDPTLRAPAPSANAERGAPPLPPATPKVSVPRVAPRAGFDAEVMEAQARQAHTVSDLPRPARPAQDDPRLAPAPSPDVGPQITDSPPIAYSPQVADPPKVPYASKVVYPPKVAPPEKAARTPRAARTVKGARSPKSTRPAKAAHTARTQHPSQDARSRRASASTLRKARAPRQRLLPDIPVDGADPHQAFSRTGVCFAYFVNNACWRVRDAYCNTALHMCIIRNCPVYHLHKETLERRFARKFEHLW